MLTMQEWLDTIDFFEQCRLRMLPLIGVGATGALEEAAYQRALQLNVGICNVLAGKPFYQSNVS